MKDLICRCGFESNSYEVMRDHVDKKNKQGMIVHFHIDNKDEKTLKEGKYYVGQVGVDSGTVIITDPCYIKHHEELYQDSKWQGFCDNMSRHDFNPHEAFSGVVSPTAHGDGGYPVYATIGKDGQVNKLEVIFSRWVNDGDYEKTPIYDIETVKERIEYFTARHIFDSCPKCGSEHTTFNGAWKSNKCKQLSHQFYGENIEKNKDHTHYVCDTCKHEFIQVRAFDGKKWKQDQENLKKMGWNK